ncbi:Primosomal protein N' [Poriferisphaera corsica]|uniref:Replication restart protein PriA n=1 Tax=Poriferisphaera corsica TaxID=2528020 RepID=A0A517YWY6_9BACT|nr:primosomal protein N' [Poriferisphaera corsica]QDU34729.1 Primosomal protein N' [Poriferisphaera corsica]
MSETLFGNDLGDGTKKRAAKVDASGGYVVVALERGGDAAGGGLTYAVGKEFKEGDGLCEGDRVMVPLGRANKKVWGYVVGVLGEEDLDAKLKGKVKGVIAKDEGRIRLTADLVELAKWISVYYCSPLGMVFAAMLPAAVKQKTGTKQVQVVRLSDAWLKLNPEEQHKKKLTKLQKAIVSKAGELSCREDTPQVGTRGLDRCADSNGERNKDDDTQQGEDWVEVKELAYAAGAKTSGPVKKLVQMGVLEVKLQSMVRSRGDLVQQAREEALAGNFGVVKPSLSQCQSDALEQLTGKLDEFAVNVLHGVTGSGKTEVYLRLIEEVLKKDERAGVIILVPEIALTPQTVGRFVGRFDGVAVLHSGLTAAQRHEQWRRIYEGEAHIVVGARSAVFAPVRDLKLILVDEEHEGSYKQDQVPRYHARDVAVKRGQLCGSNVVLGSATPSVESFYNAVKRGVYGVVSMAERVPGMKLPRVEIVDMVEERRERRGIHLLSQRLEKGIEAVVRDGGQVMLLLNRRGYANYIACPDQKCGWLMSCKYCDVSMVYHKHRQVVGGVVKCHHCGAEQLLPAICPDCGKRVTTFGLGTQRVEEELSKKFPDFTAVRMDSDTMRTGQDYQETLDGFRRGDVDILLGTQMIAKGLDFPKVRLVGVISGDTSLNMPDFRAGERTFQLIAQVCGRAGRSEKPGFAVVQTFNGDDPIIQMAAEHDYVAFAKREIEIREEVGHPPVRRMVRVVVRNKNHGKGEEHARELFEQLVRCNDTIGAGVNVLQQMPCSISRIAEYYRFEIELIADKPGQLQKLMGVMRGNKLLLSDMHTAVDVDPVVML